MEQSSNPNIYFAALPAEELAAELVKRKDDYYGFLETSGMMRKLRKSYDMYYGYSTSGFFNSSTDVGYAGEQGELSSVRVNHYRSLVQHLLVLTTQSRPALEPQAVNSDEKSEVQTVLASGILDYYMRAKRMERFLKTATEHSLIFGEGYVHVKWNVNLGAAYGVNPETQQPVKEGDLEFSNPMGPLDVIKDPSLMNSADNDWYIIRRDVNKFDLAAQYPDLAERILEVSKSLTGTGTTVTGSTPLYTNNSPLIPLYTFYHRQTPSVPEGRIFEFLTADLWLPTDGPLPYTRLPGGLPVFRISPSDFFGTPFGYTSCWDIIGLSEVIDALYSSVVTNQTTFGTQNIIAPEGHNINFQELAGGLNFLEYDPKLGKPEALQLTKTAPEIFNFIKTLEGVEQLLVGINSVVRGDPEASLKSGSALALVASQAVQFNSGLAQSYTNLLEDVGTSVIKMLQDFANTKRVASIAGKSKLYMVKEFSAEDLSMVDRVIVNVANPLTRTNEGRYEAANNLLKVPGLLKSPAEYLQVLETGKLDPMIEGQQAELMNIKAENEQMQEGQSPMAIATDAHKLHIEEHKAVLSTPNARQNPQLVQAALEHINQHINLLRTTDPALLMILGEQPIPPSLPAPPPPGQPPQPNQPPEPPQAPQHPQGPPRPQLKPVPGQPSKPLNPGSPIAQQAGGIKQPRLPTVAGTHQQYVPPNGSNGGVPPVGGA